MATVIRQQIDFPRAPARVYEALLDSRQFASFTGGRPANISPKAGGAFSMFDGHIVGRNVELKTDTRIVQAWRAINWPEGVYSIVRFDIAAHGTGARLTMEHTGFPPDAQEHLTDGWMKMYWEPLKKHLA